MTADLVSYPAFQSRFVSPRQVDIWLPPGCGNDPESRFPVLYCHDGQNLFHPETSFSGVDWGLDEALKLLIGDEKIPPPIVVGIWNTPKRVREYSPRKALSGRIGISALLRRTRSLGDAYLRFMVEELKPFVDERYPTSPDPSSTTIMGSSMGGLISLYAVCEYPAVFGGAACMSTHWPFTEYAVLSYLEKSLPPPGDHVFYFDHGTGTLDAEYEEFQLPVHDLFRKRGYQAGRDYLYRVFPGEDHSEQSWRKRVHIPLEFVLNRNRRTE